jgi:signal transduction histidine kinase
MFRLLRFYSVTSLLAIGFTGLLLVFLYRHESSQTITNMGEINNLALANTVLNAVRPQLVDYLVAVAHEPPQPATTLPPIPHALEAAIRDLMRDNSVVRIKIYNRVGTVVHSTRPGQTGMPQNEHEGEVNLGFMSAIRGQVADALIYRDSFNSFDGVTEEDNLMQTYIPVRDGVDGPIRGVFEIYTDVNPQVLENERILFKMLAGAAVILTILYATLYLLVRRADRIIEGQRRTILERSETIEQLSAKLLGSEESRRKQIAYDLHEGVAQTLSAIKMTIEGSLLDGQEQRQRTGENVIPILRDAIQEVRTMATRLRPSSLDDLGLLPTIDWYCRELGKQFDGVKASSSISFRESDIPAHLKIIIYRVIDFVSLAMAESDPKAKIAIALRRDGEDLTLSLEHEPSPGWRATELPALSEAEERITLSGGSFYAGHNLSGGMSVRAAWAVKWDWPASTADGAAVVHLDTTARQGGPDLSLASARRQSLAR